MSDGLRNGDRVSWNTPQGRAHGRVVRKLTSRTRVDGNEIAASRSEPRYLVESDKTRACAAHRPEALRRRR
jgi:hypothetical protein